MSKVIRFPHPAAARKRANSPRSTIAGDVDPQYDALAEMEKLRDEITVVVRQLESVQQSLGKP